MPDNYELSNVCNLNEKLLSSSNANNIIVSLLNSMWSLFYHACVLLAAGLDYIEVLKWYMS